MRPDAPLAMARGTPFLPHPRRDPDRFPEHSLAERLAYYKTRGNQVRDFFAQTAKENGCYIAYSAAKGGIRSLTKSVAAHCRRQGYAIRCNSVHPGAINTRMVQAALRHSSNIDLAGAQDQEAMRLQLGLGEPLDIANMVAFLASDDAKHVNGAEMVVDNGATAILAG